MIFCPNKAEEFSAALRLFYQKLIIKNGIKKNYIKSLRKIYEFEALNNDYIEPINIEAFCGELLTSVLLKKNFDYCIGTGENFLIDKKWFSALIMNICRVTNYLEITEINKYLVIKGDFKINNSIFRLTKKLNGTIFKERKKRIVAISFSLQQTKKKSEDFETAYSLLQNPLSVVNLYLID